MLLLKPQTRALLDELETRIDPETEDDFRGQWRAFLHHRFTGEIFSPKRRQKSLSALPRPRLCINDTLDDPEAMLCAQLLNVSDALASDNQNLSVRANYGTGILSSVFGAELFILPDNCNTLPTTRPLAGTYAVKGLLERGRPSLTQGLGGRVFAVGEFFREVFSHYPKIEQYVEIYHPDLQGPLDICELMWGEELFYAMYDEPELVSGLMQLITDTYLHFMERWQALVPPRDDICCHWDNLMHRGQIVLRNDSAMNLSPEFYNTFARAFDAQLMKRYGGVIHFCGRGDHYIHLLKDIPNVYGVNMSQPHLNDMEKIYQNTVDCGIQLLAFDRAAALRDVSRPGAFHSNLHCFAAQA